MRTSNILSCILLLLFFSEINVMAQNWHWAQRCGGVNFDNTNAVCADDEGNSYFGGRYWAPFAIFGQDTLPCKGLFQLFITKLDPSGNFLWTQRAGGINLYGGDQDLWDIIFEKESNSIIVTGHVVDDAQTISGCDLGDLDGVFLAKLDSQGNCIWAVKPNNAELSSMLYLCSDTNKNIFMIGNNDFDCLFAGKITVNSGSFISKFNSETGSLMWVRKVLDRKAYIGDVCHSKYALFISGGSDVNSLVMDGRSFPCEGKDAYIARFDTTGHMVWVETFGGPGDDLGASIGVDKNGNIYTCGIFNGTAQFGNITLQNGDYKDVFLAKFNEYGEAIWAKQLKLTGELYTVHHYTSSSGEIWLNGTFSGTATFGEQVVTAESGIEMFIAKYDCDGRFISVIHSANSYNHAFATNPQNELFIAGSFNGTIYFDDTKLISYGSRDGFFAKHDAITGLPGPPEAPVRQLEIFANPTTGVCTVTVPAEWRNEPSLTLHLFDGNGRQLKTFPIGSQGAPVQLSLEELATGTYHVTLGNGQKVYSGKVVFKR